MQPLLGQSTANLKQPQVWSLEIIGNHAFSDFVIKNQIATRAFSVWEKVQVWDRKGHPLNVLQIKKDVIRIRDFYYRNGFLDASVHYKIIKLDYWKRNVVFVIDEGIPITIREVKFNINPKQYRSLLIENEEFIRVAMRGELQPGGRFAKVKKVSVLNRFEKVIKNLGFTFSTIELESKVDTVSKTAVLTFQINTGPRTTISKIEIQGEDAVSEPYIIRQSGLKKGELYSLKAIKEAQRRLFDHALFNFVTISIPPQKHDSTLLLLLNIREKEIRTVELSAGFSTEEYARARVSWIHRNAFGQGHRFSVTAKASFIEQFFGMDYLFPYVFNSKSSFLISPFAQHLLQPGYELYRWGISNSLIYRYSRDLTASASYLFTQNDEVSRQADLNLPDTAKTYDLSSIQLSALYSQGLRLIDRGWVVRPTAQISGLLGTSDFQFQKLTIDLRRYIPLTGSTTLALRVQGGKIFAAQEDSLPRSVRLYLGGTTSVRGWGRNELGPKIPVYKNREGDRVSTYALNAEFERFVPVGGRTSFAFNVEIRQDLYNLIRGIGFVLFWDGGQVWRREPDIAERPLQFGVGGGLRYRSPIGPIRLDLAYKLNPAQDDLAIYNNHNYGNIWDQWALYISIGQAF